MLISKFDLCKSEWLELVFDDRNKEYGAYELRQHYAKTMIIAMGIAFFSVAILCGASIILKSHPVQQRMITVTIPDLIHPPVIEHHKKITPPPPSKLLKADPPVKPAASIKDLTPVVTEDIKADNPVKNEELEKKAISNIDIAGPEIQGNVLPKENTITSGGGSPTTEDRTVYTAAGIDVMPTPDGGDAAWSKFLSRNLRYPIPAQEEGVSGRVFISFIIEKDGHLSNIVVDRAAGHGFDEEALRVLKLAKAWKPGMQNGRPVRVKYSIPINFQLSE